MNKQVILLTDAETAPAIELVESLKSAGISLLAHDLNQTRALDEVYSESSSHPLAILYEISPLADPKDLSLVLSRATSLWPQTPIVGCRRELQASFGGYS